VTELAGGITAWEAARLPVQTASSGAPDAVKSQA